MNDRGFRFSPYQPLFFDEFFGQTYRIQKATFEEQRQGIDRWFHSPIGELLAVEYKGDARAADTGNAFIETISVDVRAVPGWAYASEADYLALYLPQLRRCYLVLFSQLRERLPDWRMRYPTRKVRNRDYCTHGLLVPLKEIETLAIEVCNVES